MSARMSLGKQRSAVAGAGKEELKADACVVADAAAHVVDVGAEPFAEVRHFVDETDLGRQHGVGGVLGHLRAFRRHDQERPFRAQDRGHKAPAARRRPPGGERRRRRDQAACNPRPPRPSLRNSGLLATSSGMLGASLDALGDLAIGPDGHGALDDDDFGTVGMIGDGVGHGPDGGQVGGAVGALRRADGDEDRSGQARCRRRGRW